MSISRESDATRMLAALELRMIKAVSQANGTFESRRVVLARYIKAQGLS